MKKWFELEVVRYLVSGLSAVATDFLIYMMLYFIFEVNPSISKGISYISGALLAFLINRAWTFDAGKSHHTHIALIKFTVLYAFSFSLNVVINALVLNISEIALLGFSFATGTSIIVNYIGQKFWVFKKIG